MLFNYQLIHLALYGVLMTIDKGFSIIQENPLNCGNKINNHISYFQNNGNIISKIPD